jgi:glutamyl-tRNA synthetase
LRAALTGATFSPPVFEVMAALGRDETLGRIADAVGGTAM